MRGPIIVPGVLCAMLFLGCATARTAQPADTEAAKPVGEPAGTAVRTPLVLAEGQVDTSSVESIIAGIIEPGMTQRQKAEAVYDFVRAHIFHAPAPREGPRANNFAYGVVYDPVKLVNVYGYTYCFGNRSALEGLWEAAGLEARGAGIGGHAIAEVYYDGQYHYYDANQQGYFLLPDGETVASMDQLERDPIRLILNQQNPSDPFFPAAGNPKVPYESRVILAAYFASRERQGPNANYHMHDTSVLRHRMSITLVPGMRYIRNFYPQGKYNYRPGQVADELENGYFDPVAGPQDFVSDRRYGNGHLLWQPDLRKSVGEYAAGVWDDSNIAQDEAGLTPEAPGQPARAVFRIALPYIIVGWPTSWESPPNPVGAAVVAATLHRKSEQDRQAISVSTDRGRTWTTAWTNEKLGTTTQVIDLSEHVVHHYKYLLRFELEAKENPADSRLSALSMNTSFQVAPTSLPALRPGDNQMTFKLGDETETEITTLDLSSSEAFQRDVHSFNGIWFRPWQIRGRQGQVGEVIYELTPPKPGTVAHVAAGAGCRRQPWRLHHQDDVKIYVAENEPKDWKLVFDDDVPIYMRHWSYRAFGSTDCSPGTERAYVKFAVRTESSVTLQELWLRMHWRPDGPPGLPERGVKVTHLWAEGGEERRHVQKIDQAPMTYTVTTGEDVVNRSVIIEPVRDPRTAWRENDPPLARPEPDPPQFLDRELRDEIRMLLRNIDDDPDEWLPIATEHRNEWLAGAARQGIAMFRMRFPIEPWSPGPMPELDADEQARLAEQVAASPVSRVIGQAATLLALGHPSGRDAAREVMAGPNRYQRLGFVRAVNRYAVPAVPDELLAGLTDDSRWVRLAVLQMIRRAPSKTALEAVAGMAEDDPLEWLREEAKSTLADAE